MHIKIGQELYTKKTIVTGKTNPTEDELCVYDGPTTSKTLIGRHGYFQNGASHKGAYVSDLRIG